MSKTLPAYIEHSPTAKILVDYHPEDSVVTREQIENEYILLSKSEARGKRPESNSNRSYSVRLTRKRRGARLFKVLTQEGFWKEKV